MPSSSSHLRQVVIDAIRQHEVASQAQVAAITWASETAPRVFPGRAGFIGGRNRGRLPFVEVEFIGQTFANEVEEGGTLKTKIRLIAHATGRDQQTAEELLSAIITESLVQIRDVSQDNYTRLGDDEIMTVQPGPFGWMLEAQMEVEHSFQRDDYEVT